MVGRKSLWIANGVGVAGVIWLKVATDNLLKKASTVPDLTTGSVYALPVFDSRPHFLTAAEYDKFELWFVALMIYGACMFIASAMEIGFSNRWPPNGYWRPFPNLDNQTRSKVTLSFVVAGALGALILLSIAMIFYRR
jgi:hypothetical protein